jgi:hypothetical protein
MSSSSGRGGVKRAKVTSGQLAVQEKRDRKRTALIKDIRAKGLTALATVIEIPKIVHDSGFFRNFRGYLQEIVNNPERFGLSPASSSPAKAAPDLTPDFVQTAANDSKRLRWSKQAL